MMLGKTLMKLKQTDAAIFYLERAKSFPIKNDDDQKVFYILNHFKTCSIVHDDKN